MSVQAGCGPPKKRSTLSRAIVGEVLAALVGGHAARRRRPPAAASRSARRSRRRPRPPGRRGRCRPWPRSGRRPSGRRPRRRAASTARSRPAAAAAPGRSTPPVVVTTTPSGRADQRRRARSRPCGCGTPCPATSVIVCMPPLGVGQLDPVARARAVRAGGRRRSARWRGRVGGMVGRRSRATSRRAGEARASTSRGREHAEDAAVRRRPRGTRSPAGRRSACDQAARRPGRPRSDEPGLERAGPGRRPATHGRRSTGVAATAASLTMPSGAPVAVDHDERRGRPPRRAGAAPRRAACRTAPGSRGG